MTGDAAVRTHPEGRAGPDGSGGTGGTRGWPNFSAMSAGTVDAEQTDAESARYGSSRIGLVLGLIWLIYFIAPLTTVLHHRAGWERDIGLLAWVGFALTYIVGLAIGRKARATERQLPVRPLALVIAGLAVFGVGLVPATGDGSLIVAPYVCAFVVMTSPRIVAIAAVVAIIAMVELAGNLVPGWQDHGYGFGVALVAIAVGSLRLAFDRNRALLDAQRKLSDLAVEEERSRIARDLHDILGHTLTVLTVKSELAQRLLDVDTERARAELVDLERLCRDALADVRATAMGVRGVSLPGEIAAARNALESAGIDARLPTVADDVPSRWRELFAWTIRESVTNVVRHSRARACTIEMSAHRISVTDDGVGLAEGTVTGSGLRGLRQRAELAGAALSTRPGPGGRGVQVLVEVPA
jgi:two-component system, NarL family, sensor histidine kinase DesK